jgi:hypothetical protein
MVGDNFLIFHFEIPGVAIPLAAPAQPPLTWEEFGRKLELLGEEKNRTASMSTVITDGAHPVESICTLATIAAWEESQAVIRRR